jgi:hypothetical protein
MTQLVTTKHKLHAARQVLESITEPANSTYYVFLGDHMEHESSDIADIVDSPRQTVFDPYRNMIQGKRVSSNDAAIVVRNIPYVANTVYDMYDDDDDELIDKDFYVIVNASSTYHLFKCLDNNLDSPSTVEPDFSHIVGSNTFVYQTSDGYRWKYMFTVTSAQKTKFATTDFFPIFANTTVEANAIPGSIDIIKILEEGAGYDNYTEGTLAVDDIRVEGNSQVYRIVNSVASATNGFFTHCIMYLSTGTGSGQYRSIHEYFVNADGKFVVVNNAFTTTPTTGTEYEIFPAVIIGGTGQTTNAVARALINSSASNSVYRVEMLTRGRDYLYANAYVEANAVVGVGTNAELRPIYSPPSGHGYDAGRELFASRLMFSVKFSNNESNTLLTTNQFQQIGLIQDPLFANVTVDMTSVNGTFSTSERIFKINPIRVAINATMNTTSAIVSCNTGDFENQLTVGGYVYLHNAGNSEHQIASVNSITNSSQFVLTTNGYFACTDTLIYLAGQSSNAIVTDLVDSNTLRLSNVAGVFSADDRFIGWASGALATIDTISRSGDEKGFETFINLYKYEGTAVSGTFLENEHVYQVPNVTTAALFTVIDNGGNLKLYVSNVVGEFVLTTIVNNMTGNTSGAEAYLSDVHCPELVFGSGDILFVENVSPVERMNTQSETFKLIFEF